MVQLLYSPSTLGSRKPYCLHKSIYYYVNKKKLRMVASVLSFFRFRKWSLKLILYDVLFSLWRPWIVTIIAALSRPWPHQMFVLICLAAKKICQ